jgi:hypothetical protein
VRYVAELELGPCYGPARGTRLIAATADPAALKPESAWFMAANLTLAGADAAGACRICRLRDRAGHSCKPATHELGWADFQVRSEQAIVRHWQLVMPAFTFSPLAAAPAEQAGEAAAGDGGPAGGNPRRRIIWRDTRRQVRSWLCPWARLQLYWHRWSTAPPPSQLAALLDHVSHSRPLAAPT